MIILTSDREQHRCINWVYLIRPCAATSLLNRSSCSYASLSTCSLEKIIDAWPLINDFLEVCRPAPSFSFWKYFSCGAYNLHESRNTEWIFIGERERKLRTRKTQVRTVDVFIGQIMRLKNWNKYVLFMFGPKMLHGFSMNIQMSNHNLRSHLGNLSNRLLMEMWKIYHHLNGDGSSDFY